MPVNSCCRSVEEDDEVDEGEERTERPVARVTVRWPTGAADIL